MTVPARISIVTLGVADLARSIASGSPDGLTARHQRTVTRTPPAPGASWRIASL